MSRDPHSIPMRPFELHAAGSGEINAARLQARRASARIAGSVRHFGDPAVDKTVVGSGSVLRLGTSPP